MKLLKYALILVASVLLLSVVMPPALIAQNLDPAELLNPPPDSWPGYHGDYSGQRHSQLAQITPQNVAKPDSGLGLPDQPESGNQIVAAAGRWRSVLHGAGQRLGRRCALRPQIWHYTYPTNKGFHIGHRGVACTRTGSTS